VRRRKATLVCVTFFLLLAPTVSGHAADEPVSELETLRAQYRELVGQALGEIPLLEWHAELYDIQKQYDDMLDDRKRDHKTRMSLPKDVQKQYFDIRRLAAWSTIASYKGNEAEFRALFMQTSKKDVSVTAQEKADKVAVILAKARKAQKELERLIQASRLPPKLISRAKMEGKMGGRTDILESALARYESLKANKLGRSLQLLEAEKRGTDFPDPDLFAADILEKSIALLPLSEDVDVGKTPRSSVHEHAEASARAVGDAEDEKATPPTPGTLSHDTIQTAREQQVLGDADDKKATPGIISHETMETAPQAQIVRPIAYGALLLALCGAASMAWWHCLRRRRRRRKRT